MSDPLSITASVIAVAGLAYSSCKTLHDTIECFRNAPETLVNLRKDLVIVQNLLDSLKGVLDGVQNSALSPNQQACFLNLKPAIEHCETTCSNFTGRLSQLTSHSGQNRVNWFDKARLHFNENDISLLKTTLERDKQTIDVALQLAARSMSLSSISMKREDVEMVQKVLSEHDVMLKQCLKVCETGLKETTAATGTNVKHAIAFNKASVFVGNMGYDGQTYSATPATKLDRLEARDQGKSAAGNMSGDVAKTFWSA